MAVLLFAPSVFQYMVLGKGLSFFSICNQGSGEEARVVPTGQTQDLECGLLISSIGYKSLPIDPAVPFDPCTSTVPNAMGRVLQTEGNLIISVAVGRKQATRRASCICPPDFLPDAELSISFSLIKNICSFCSYFI